MTTTLDKFRGAALSLARSGSIKDRLTDAYRNHLAFVEESELPTELVEEFRAVSYALNRQQPLLRGEDAFRATVRKMSKTEADDVASCVVRLFGEISREPAFKLIQRERQRKVEISRRLFVLITRVSLRSDQASPRTKYKLRQRMHRQPRFALRIVVRR